MPLKVFDLGYEFSTSFGKGTKAAPELVKNQLKEDFHWIPLKDEIKSMLPDLAMEKLQNHVTENWDFDNLKVFIGGEHSASIGAIKCWYKQLPIVQRSNAVLIHLDAHSDLRNSYQGSKNSHACIISRVLEETKLSVYSFGIRSLTLEDFYHYKENSRLKVFYSHEYFQKKNSNKVPKSSTELKRVFESFKAENLKQKSEFKEFSSLFSSLKGRACYLTIDMDFFDPEEFPGLGTPEPFGASFEQGLGLLQLVFKYLRPEAVDIMEYCPNFDKTQDGSEIIASLIGLFSHWYKSNCKTIDL